MVRLFYYYYPSGLRCPINWVFVPAMKQINCQKNHHFFIIKKHLTFIHTLSSSKISMRMRILYWNLLLSIITVIGRCWAAAVINIFGPSMPPTPRPKKLCHDLIWPVIYNLLIILVFLLASVLFFKANCLVQTPWGLPLIFFLLTV